MAGAQRPAAMLLGEDHWLAVSAGSSLPGSWRHFSHPRNTTIHTPAILIEVKPCTQQWLVTESNEFRIKLHGSSFLTIQCPKR